MHSFLFLHKRLAELTQAEALELFRRVHLSAFLGLERECPQSLLELAEKLPEALRNEIRLAPRAQTIPSGWEEEIGDALQPIERARGGLQRLEIPEPLAEMIEPPSASKLPWENFETAAGDLAPGRVFYLGSRPGVGKTSFAYSMVAALVQGGRSRIGIFSMEQTKEEIVRKVLCTLAGVDIQDPVGGETDWVTLGAAAELLGKAPVYVDDAPNRTAEAIQSACEKIQQRDGKLDFIVIDYLQLMSFQASGLERREQMGRLGRELKQLAVRFRLTVLVLFQLPRDWDAGDRLAVLQKHLGILDSADVLATLHRGPAPFHELKFWKSRGGTAKSVYFRARAGKAGLVFEEAKT